MSVEAPWEDDISADEAAPWESDQAISNVGSATDVPQADDSITKGAVMKETRGFEKLENVVHLMKTESIPAHLMKWLTTPEETYRKKERIEKDEYIKSIPMLSSMSNRLDEIEWIAAQEGYTGNLENEHNNLIDAYGTAYGKMEEAYDDGELETGFSWEGFKGAIKDDPSGMLSEVVNVFMADPELLMTPIGWEYAASRAGAVVKGLGASEKVIAMTKVTGGIAGSAALGSGLAVTDNVARQLSETGKIDQGQAFTAAKIGAAAAPILIGGFKLAKVGSQGAYGKISEGRFNSQFKKSITRVESKAQDYMSKGLIDEQAAIHRSINNSYIPKNVRQAMSERHDWMRNINLSEEAVDAKRVSLAADASKFKTKFYETMAGPKKVVTDLLGNLSTEIGFVHEGLRHAVKRLDMDTAISMKHGLDVKDIFKGVYKGLAKEDQTKLNIALGNGNKKSIDDILSRSTSSGESKATVQKQMDDYFKDVYNRSEVAGMGIKQIDNYHPMEVKDYHVFARHMGFNPNYVDESLSKAIKKKYKDAGGEITGVKSHTTLKEAEDFLTNDEIVNVLNKALATPFKSAGKSTSHMKGRTIEVYNSENIKFYKDPIETFANYVTSMEPKIQETMFFGGRQGAAELPHSAFLARSIGGLTKRLLDNGEIIPDDLARLEELLTARFVQGTRAPAKFITGTKNILYSATLGNPLSAMTQIGDVGSAAYINGVMETLRTTPIVMAGKGIFKMEDFGLNNIVQEFEHLGKTARILDVSLKWSGFKAIDRLGKEVLLNSTIHKYGKMAKTVKGRKELVAKYRDAFTPSEMNRVLDDLQKGNHTQDVKYLMWHELTRVQPVSLSEMPVSYLRNPNARMFYMLKTFTLKQLDLMRREAYQKIKSGDVVGGMSNLTRWTGILGLSNATVEQSKAWVRGEDVEFGDMFYAQMFRNYGLSQYVLDQIKRGQPVLAATTLAMPPIGIGDDVVQDLVNFGDTFKSLKHVPVFGKGMYYLFDMGEK